MLLMVNTGLRPDESKRIRFRDVAIVDDDCSKETVVENRRSWQARRRLLQEHAGCRACWHGGSQSPTNSPSRNPATSCSIPFLTRPASSSTARGSVQSAPQLNLLLSFGTLIDALSAPKVATARCPLIVEPWQMQILRTLPGPEDVVAVAADPDRRQVVQFAITALGRRGVAHGRRHSSTLRSRTSGRVRDPRT